MGENCRVIATPEKGRRSFADRKSCAIYRCFAMARLTLKLLVTGTVLNRCPKLPTTTSALYGRLIPSKPAFVAILSNSQRISFFLLIWQGPASVARRSFPILSSRNTLIVTRHPWRWLFIRSLDNFPTVDEARLKRRERSRLRFWGVEEQIAHPYPDAYHRFVIVIRRLPNA